MFQPEMYGYVPQQLSISKTSCFCDVMLEWDTVYFYICIDYMWSEELEKCHRFTRLDTQRKHGSRNLNGCWWVRRGIAYNCVDILWESNSTNFLQVHVIKMARPQSQNKIKKKIYRCYLKYSKQTPRQHNWCVTSGLERKSSDSTNEEKCVWVVPGFTCVSSTSMQVCE